MKKSFSQIALFDFVAEPEQQPVDRVPEQDHPEVNDTHPQISAEEKAGVRARVKSLKKDAPEIQNKDNGYDVIINTPIVVPAQHPDPVGLPSPQPAGHAPQPPPAKSKRGRKSLKQTAAEADLIDIPDDETLFLKQYYTMGEVAGMFRVNQSLLRFWETEFSILQPRKNKKGDRHFRPVDIKNLHLIYHLLRQRKYTIEGAKDFLKKNKKVEERFEAIKRLEQVKGFLLEWKAQL